MEKLFDSQIKTLRDRNCPELIVTTLKDQRESAIKEASTITIAPQNLPFLPVISKISLNLKTQISMVRNGNFIGITALDPRIIFNATVAAPPKSSYYIFDVDAGGETRGQSFDAITTLLAKQGRRRLGDAEIIALATHTNILQKHFLHSGGYYYYPSQIISLWISPDRHLLLGFQNPSSSNNQNRLFGTPSCSEEVKIVD